MPLQVGMKAGLAVSPLPGLQPQTLLWLWEGHKVALLPHLRL